MKFQSFGKSLKFGVALLSTSAVSWSALAYGPISVNAEFNCLAAKEATVPERLNFVDAQAHTGRTFFQKDLALSGNSARITNGKLILMAGEYEMNLGPVVSETDDCPAGGTRVVHVGPSTSAVMTMISQPLSACYAVTTDGIFGFDEVTTVSFRNVARVTQSLAHSRTTLNFQSELECQKARTADE